MASKGPLPLEEALRSAMLMCDQLEAKAASNSGAADPADIYTFGGSLYEMLMGRPISPQRRPVQPAALERVLEKCLAANPAERWRSAGELRQALLQATKRPRFPLEYAIGATAILMLLVGLALLMIELSPGRPLTEKDTLVLGDFTNNTKDPVFDGSLGAALRILVEQSPFYKLLSEDRMAEDEKNLGRPASARLTNQVAHDICQRDGAKAMLNGSISDIGNAYAISLQAINCQTGFTLAREQSEAINKEHVLSAMSAVLTAMRLKLGESVGTVQKFNAPIAQVTTQSLEALQAYARGEALLRRGALPAAIAFFKRSTEIDPKFAMGFVGWANACTRAADQSCAAEESKNAFAQMGNLTLRERLAVSASYYRVIAQDVKKAIDTDQEWARTYPRDAEPHAQLAQIYDTQGDSQRAAQERAQAAALQ